MDTEYFETVAKHSFCRAFEIYRSRLAKNIRSINIQCFRSNVISANHLRMRKSRQGGQRRRERLSLSMMMMLWLRHNFSAE